MVYLNIFESILINIVTMFGLQKAFEYHAKRKEDCIYSVEIVTTQK
jgi:hypothetical protein